MSTPERPRAWLRITRAAALVVMAQPPPASAQPVKQFPAIEDQAQEPPASEAPLPAPTADTNRPCRADGDCETGQACLAGVCRVPERAIQSEPEPPRPRAMTVAEPEPTPELEVTSEPRQARDGIRNTMAFALYAGSAWGGAYDTERDVTKSGAMAVIYDNGQIAPVEFTILTIGIGITYERGSPLLRLGATILGRFDPESYETKAPAGYEPLSGDGLLAWRLGLYVGPGFTFAQSRTVSLDGRIEFGGVVGGFRPLAGVADAVRHFEQNVSAPTEATLLGVGGRAWLAVMFGAPHGKAGGRGGFGVLYEGTWVHADLFEPWPDSWFEHNLALMGQGQVMW